jgi:hypothetical protein
MAKRRSQLWSAEEDAELRALAASDLSSTRMAVRLGRSAAAIKSRLRKIGRANLATKDSNE